MWKNIAKLILGIAGVSLAQTPQPQRFEVASIRPSSAERGASSGIGTGNGRLNAQNVTLLRCIIGAYTLGPSQITGGPDWLDSDRFDILAKAEDSINDDSEFMAMLQILLAERFKLVAHRETRMLPVLVLEVTKNGPKMKASEGESIRNTRNSNTGVRMDIQNTSMDMFAHVLAQQMDRPVLNRTGLDGLYSFELQWTPENRSRSSDTADSGSIFTAIQEQLGLRLRSERAPVEVLVIDSAARPSEN